MTDPRTASAEPSSTGTPICAGDFRPRRVGSPIARLLPWLAPEAKALVWTVVVDVLANVTLVAQTALMAWAVAHAITEHQAPPPSVVGAALGLVLLRMVLTWHEMDLSHDVAYRVLAHLRRALFGAFARAVPQRGGGQHTGGLASTALGDVEKLEFFYAHTVPQLVSALVLLIVGTVTLLSVSPTLVFVLPAAALALVALGALTARPATRLGDAELAAKERLAASVVDVVRATREVVAFGRENAMTDAIVRAGQRVDEAAAASARAQARSETAREAIILAAVVAVLWLNLSHGVAGPTASAVTVGVLTALAPIDAAAATVNRLQPMRAAARLVADTIDLPAQGLPLQDGGVNPPPGPLGFTWNNLQLNFDSASVQLPDGQVHPGEHVALVGPSGCGKSSLVTLLCGLWTPDAGSIDLFTPRGHFPLESMSAHARCHRIAVIDQDATVLHGSLRDNLTLGAPDASDAQLVKALETAGLKLVGERWRDGLDSMIGESGKSLSGGQRARLALARALVQEPSALILDETTSGLDAKTEADVLGRLTALPVTLIVVSHRQATVDAMDRVIDLGA